MKISKTRLKRLIQEEYSRLVNENRGDLKDFEVTLVVRVPARSVEYVINAVEEGMEFDYDAGEGILESNIKELKKPQFIDMQDPRGMK